MRSQPRHPNESFPVGELENAAKRIGHTTKKRLAWAFRFAQQDLGKLNAGELLNLRVELSVFRNPELLSAFASWNKTRPIPSPGLLLVNLGDVRNVQSDFVALLEAIQNRRKIYFSARLGVEIDFGSGRNAAIRFTGGTDAAKFRFAELLSQYPVADLLGAIRRCIQCKRLFFGPKNKKFCSKACLSKETTRRWRKAKDK